MKQAFMPTYLCPDTVIFTPEEARTAISFMQTTGIDAAAVSWDGHPERERPLAMFADVAQEMDFKFFTYFETIEILDKARHVPTELNRVRRHAKHPAYLQRDGKPMICLYQADQYKATWPVDDFWTIGEGIYAFNAPRFDAFTYYARHNIIDPEADIREAMLRQKQSGALWIPTFEAYYNKDGDKEWPAPGDLTGKVLADDMQRLIDNKIEFEMSFWNTLNEGFMYNIIDGLENTGVGFNLKRHIPKVMQALIRSWKGHGQQTQLKGEVMPETIESCIERWFVYHAPTSEQIPKYNAIRDAAKQFALLIAENVPECGEQFLAIQKLREAVMIANAGIACNGGTDGR